MKGAHTSEMCKEVYNGAEAQTLARGWRRTDGLWWKELVFTLHASVFWTPKASGSSEVIYKRRTSDCEVVNGRKTFCTHVYKTYNTFGTAKRNNVPLRYTEFTHNVQCVNNVGRAETHFFYAIYIGTFWTVYRPTGLVVLSYHKLDSCSIDIFGSQDNSISSWPRAEVQRCISRGEWNMCVRFVSAEHSCHERPQRSILAVLTRLRNFGGIPKEPV